MVKKNLPYRAKNLLHMFLLSIFLIHTVSAQLVPEDYNSILSVDTVKVEAGWNLLSLPIVVDNGIKNYLFPSATSQAFIYRNSYLSKDTLENGYGFWLKFDSDGNIPVSGETVYADTIVVYSGWNIIGSLSNPVDVDSIITFPPGIIISGIFGYVPGFGYQETDTIDPALGYWVKVNQDGLIYMHAGSGTGGGKPCVGIPTVEWGGKTYNTVQIGTQCWLMENLDVGTRINGNQTQTNNGIVEKYCYNDDPAYCQTYGGLYQWNEAMQYSTAEASEGICPPDWHIPAYVDIETLKVAVNYSANALKAVGQGDGAGAGTNTSGFSGFLAGNRDDYTLFTGMGIIGYFWGSRNISFPDYFYLLNNNNSIGSYVIYPIFGFSVRCVRYVDTTNHPPTYPINPVPAHYASGIPTLLDLKWDCSDIDGDALRYDVYFGTDNPPATKIVTNISIDYLQDVGPLDRNTLYSWRVIAKDSRGDSTIGDVWRFTTGAWGTPCAGIPTVEYGGKTYHTVQIGTQCWMQENLCVGTTIHASTDQTNNGIIEKYCYQNDPAKCDDYGGLYQWNETMQYSTTPGVQGICPAGWHIPTLTEYQTLSTAVGGSGNALKALWQGAGDGAGTNTSGFSALEAGERIDNGVFHNLRNNSYMWSSTEEATEYSFSMDLFSSDTGIGLYSYEKWYGFSIRCLKD